MTRRQGSAHDSAGSGISPIIGAALGLPLEWFLHASGRAAQDLAPVASLVAFAVVAFLSGVLAAIAPARRASRLDVLTALLYE